MANVMISETFINHSKGYCIGDTDPYEPYHSDNIGKLFRVLSREYGRCISSVYLDGADYGFWPSLDSLEEDARYLNGVIKVNEGDEWLRVDPDDSASYILVNGGPKGHCDPDQHSCDQPIDYVMSVSDHGNVTLYDARTRAIIWSIV